MASAPRRILVTRTAGQASELAERLRALGMEPLLLPTLAIVPPSSYAALDAALAQLAAFHWLLFTSANAVEAFTARREPCGPSILSGSQAWKGMGFSPSDNRQENAGALAPAGIPWPKIAAIGPATARVLAAAGHAATLVPPQAVAESLAAALLPHTRQPDGSPTRFLLVRAEQARDVLPETLRAAGAEVTVAAAYRTVVPPESLASVRNLFAAPQHFPDAITFTSASSVHNLLNLLDQAGLSLPPDVARVSIGPITSQALAAAGFPATREAATASITALAAACAALESLA